MKRKLFIITLVLALLLSAYTAYACLSTRGLRVYLMGTQSGAILAGTWQFSLLAAIVLWIPGVVTLLRKASGLRRHTVASTELQPSMEDTVEEEYPDAAGPLQPRGAVEKKTRLLRPRRGADQKTEPIQPQKDVERVTEPVQPRRSADQKTEPIQPRKGAERVTEPVQPRRSADQKTEPIQPRKGAEQVTEPIQPQRSVEQKTEPPQVCPNCGHPVTGKKFCAKCGTKIG